MMTFTKTVSKVFVSIHSNATNNTNLNLINNSICQKSVFTIAKGPLILD